MESDDDEGVLLEIGEDEECLSELSEYGSELPDVSDEEPDLPEDGLPETWKELPEVEREDLRFIDAAELFAALEELEGSGSSSGEESTAAAAPEAPAPSSSAPRVRNPAPAWRKLDEEGPVELFVDENKAQDLGFVEEAQEVAKRWKDALELQGLKPDNFTHHLSFWIGKSGLFEFMLQRMRSNLRGSDVQPDDVTKFLFVLLRMSESGFSPKGWFGRPQHINEEDKRFVIDEAHFNRLLKAIYPRADRGSAGRGPGRRLPSPQELAAPTGPSIWAMPFQADANMRAVAAMMRKLSNFACKMCLTKWTTLSNDDDVVRFVPKTLVQYGLRQECNAKKGRGAHIDGCGSVGTGIMLSQSLHLTGGGLVGSVQETLKPIEDARREGTIVPVDTRFVLAMGYGYNSEPLTKELTSKGYYVAGTHARKRGFPFAWAPTKMQVPEWGLIPVQQPRLATWATREYDGPSGDQVAGLALAYSEGRRKTNVAILHTTDPRLNPRQWSYVTYTRTQASGAQVRERRRPPSQVARPLAFQTAPERRMAADLEAIQALTQDRNTITAFMVSKGHDATLVEAYLDRAAGLGATAGGPDLSAPGAFAALGAEESADLRADAFCAVEQRFIKLTETQRSQDWLALRFGRVTSTGLVTLMAALLHGKNRELLHGVHSGMPTFMFGTVEALAKCLQIRTDLNATEPIQAALDKVYDGSDLHDALNALQIDQLRKVCRGCGMIPPCDLNKAGVLRLVESLVANVDIVRTCLATATLKPFSPNQSTAIGTLNENVVLAALPLWLRGAQAVEGAWPAQEYGLVHAIGLPTHATSVDGLLAFVPKAAEQAPEVDDLDTCIPLLDAGAPPASVNAADVNAYGEARRAAKNHAQRAAGRYGSVCFAAVEIKTRTKPALVAREEQLAAHSKYAEVHLDPNANDYDAGLAQFKMLVFDKGHRHQLLQHTAAGVCDVFYVVAKATIGSSKASIVRVVRVRFVPSIVARLAAVVGFLGYRHMRWVWDEAAPLPADERLTIKRPRWPLKADHVKQMRALGLAIVAAGKARGAPLPPARKIVPRLVDWWNNFKWVQDQLSQKIKGIEPRIFHVSPPTRIIIRLILTCVLNAVKTLTLCAMAKRPEEWSMSARAYRRRMAKLASPSSVLAQVSAADLARGMALMQPRPVGSGSQVSAANNQNVVLMFRNQLWEPRHNVAQARLVEAASERLRNTPMRFVSRYKLYNEDEMLNFLRRTSYLGTKHKPTVLSKRSKCWLCCRLCEKHGGGHDAPRVHGQSQAICKECIGVPLCTKGREQFGGMSCFEVWHDPRMDTVHGGLPEPCMCPCTNQNVPFGDPFKSRPVEASGLAAAEGGGHIASTLSTPDILASHRRRRKRRRTESPPPTPPPAPNF